MRRALLVGLLFTGMAVGVVSPAQAHTVLVSTDPEPGASLTSGPQRVTAVFNEDVQATFAAMTVVGPDGNLWSAPDAEVRGPTVSVGMRPTGPAGAYTVNYRVTSADGHVVSGSWSFSVVVPGTGSPGSSASAPAADDRIPLWPFAAAAVAAVAAAGFWARGRQR